MSPFAEHLYQLRQRLKLSQRALADLVGYEQGMISALELDKTSPTDEFVDKLIGSLDLSSSELEQLKRLAKFSQRKYTIPPGTPAEAFPMVYRLWNALPELQSLEIRIIENLLSLQEQRCLALKGKGHEEGRLEM